MLHLLRLKRPQVQWYLKKIDVWQFLQDIILSYFSHLCGLNAITGSWKWVTGYPCDSVVQSSREVYLRTAPFICSCLCCRWIWSLNNLHVVFWSFNYSFFNLSMILRHSGRDKIDAGYWAVFRDSLLKVIANEVVLKTNRNTWRRLEALLESNPSFSSIVSNIFATLNTVIAANPL